MVKREVGESPARTRRCNGEVLFHNVTGCKSGKTKQNVGSEVRRPAYDGTWKTTSNWLVHNKKKRLFFYCYDLFAYVCKEVFLFAKDKYQ